MRFFSRWPSIAAAAAQDSRSQLPEWGFACFGLRQFRKRSDGSANKERQAVDDYRIVVAYNLPLMQVRLVRSLSGFSAIKFVLPLVEFFKLTSSSQFGLFWPSRWVLSCKVTFGFGQDLFDLIDFSC